ncbi:peptide IlvX [Citrobacter rodentium]|nr:peptide IlvX [Citrobacter rodentium NBRC 105723 = DSM 16636]
MNNSIKLCFSGFMTGN